MKLLKCIISIIVILLLLLGTLFAQVQTFVSWNMWLFGASAIKNKERMVCVSDVLKNLKPDILLAQEVISRSGHDTIIGILNDYSQEKNSWEQIWSTGKGTANQGNSIFWLRKKYAIGPLGSKTLKDYQHPVIMVHLKDQGSDFDFTVFSIHLTFRGGKTEASAAELKKLLEYILDNISTVVDTEFLIAGDYNMPMSQVNNTKLDRSKTIFDTLVTDMNRRFKSKNIRIISYVDIPTSRSLKKGGVAKNNYDHFIMSSSFKEKINLTKINVAENKVMNIESSHNNVRTSDHFPILIKLIPPRERKDAGKIQKDSSVNNTEKNKVKN
jgi:endonuclease/exonuclease/phosphatase family metal-dependent hydrolase